MLIPRVTSSELRERPDQFCETINRLVDAVNELNKK